MTLHSTRTEGVSGAVRVDEKVTAWLTAFDRKTEYVYIEDIGSVLCGIPCVGDQIRDKT